MSSKEKEIKETPLMKQYNAIKVKYPDACLLFRVGDFYETFGEDAVRTSKILGIVLTKRGAGSETETALAGFPHHSLNTYLPKLVKAGLRVAICDQLEDPKMTKTIVKRGVTELVTPGVSLNDEVLQSKSNNFLAALHFGKKNIGISFLDVSTGEFLTAQGNREYIDKLLQNFSPSEVLVAKPFKNEFSQSFGSAYHAFYLEDWIYKEDYAFESLTKHFQTNSLKGFGIDDFNEAVFMRPGQSLTRVLAFLDKRVVDGAVSGVGAMTLRLAGDLRKTQSGYVRSYALLILLGAVAILTAILVVSL